MKFLAITALAAMAAPAFAQSSSSASTAATATSSSSAAGATHTVTVGRSGLVFDPPSIQAAVGDVVSFVYFPKAHSVTQSTFGSPCSLLQNATSGAVGFDSGLTPVAANATVNPVWSIKVTGTAPIWYYCKQTGHCVAGMVGAINAPATGNTFDNFLAAAKASNVTNPSGSGNPSGGVGASASAAPSGASGIPSGSTGAASHVTLSAAVVALGGVLALAAGLA